MFLCKLDYFLSCSMASSTTMGTHYLKVMFESDVVSKSMNQKTYDQRHQFALYFLR